MADHHAHMQHALHLARRGLGRVAPNPAVGCVIVKDERVIGRGRTQDGGRPHAETEALKQAGEQAQGATAYVTLEPCAHHGKTPPCSEALIKAGIAHVVIACTDPDPRTAGKGIAILQEAGIEVTTGICEDEALQLNAGFFLRITKNRPYITLKIATSADNKIAAAEGERTTITGPIAHRYTHLLRSLHDAILVGKTTNEVDNPKLNTRIEGYPHDLKRFVLNTDHFSNPHDLTAVLHTLAGQGITRLLVEGGAKTHTSFLEAGYCDEFQWLQSNSTIGPQGVEALYNHDISLIENEFGLQRQKTKALGEDLLAIYTPKA